VVATSTPTKHSLKSTPALAPARFSWLAASVKQQVFVSNARLQNSVYFSSNLPDTPSSELAGRSRPERSRRRSLGAAPWNAGASARAGRLARRRRRTRRASSGASLKNRRVFLRVIIMLFFLIFNYIVFNNISAF
jgi:hypothetical protein